MINEGTEKGMKLAIMITLYIAQFALAVVLTDICLRRWKRTAGAAGKLRISWLIPFALLASLPVAGALLPDSRAAHLLQAAGNIWLGFYLYFGGLLAVLMGAAWLIRALSRRKLGKNVYGGILCLSLIAAFALFGFGLVHARHTKVVSYDIPVEKSVTQNEKSMKAVLVADLHLGVNSHLAMTERMVDLINEQEPDVVVIAGDIFTSTYGGLAHPDRYAQALRGIRSKYGVYAVYGNHDVEEPLLGGFSVAPISKAFRSSEMEAFFESSGFTALSDETVTLPNGVQLVGRIDQEKAGDGTNNRMAPQVLLAEANPDLPVLVLQHEPTEFAALAEAGADLVMCGHTHAGQIFPGNLIVPFFTENAWGHKVLYGMDTVVTAGVGYYGPPMRIGTDSEITVIRLSFQ